ncbi:translation initiation factor IF-2-like [Accipiter gentilis]|uniref:translation initiation factor IF-2-like n=1 Tax=Astur gentilis TaxID=8957 RepID=UPI00210F7052|nr:translation initiation factor IF-2-like [Accipiter gentilis]
MSVPSQPFAGGSAVFPSQPAAPASRQKRHGERFQQPTTDLAPPATSAWLVVLTCKARTGSPSTGSRAPDRRTVNDARRQRPSVPAQAPLPEALPTLAQAEPTSLQRRGEGEPAPADGANLPRDAAGCRAPAAGTPGDPTGNNRPGRAAGEGAAASADPCGGSAGTSEPPRQSTAARGWEAAGRAGRRTSGRLHGAPPAPRRRGHCANRRPSVCPGSPEDRSGRPTEPGTGRSLGYSPLNECGPGEGASPPGRHPLLLLPPVLLLGTGEKDGFAPAGRSSGGGGRTGRGPPPALSRSCWSGLGVGGRWARCRRAGHTCRPLSRRPRGWTAEATGWECAGFPPPPAAPRALQRRWRGSVQPPPPRRVWAARSSELPGLRTPFPPGSAGVAGKGHAAAGPRV